MAITQAMVVGYAAAWDEANETDGARDGPLWVVLGDSTAQGIGASSFDRGYVGQMRERLDRCAPTPWRVLNLSRSGDRLADVLANQLPRLRVLGAPPALVSCIVGANDMFKTPLWVIGRRLRELCAALPAEAVIGSIPQGLLGFRARATNTMIAVEAATHGLRVADIWRASGPPWQGKYAPDNFHPNDAGYQSWTLAIAAAIGLDAESASDQARGGPG